MWMSSPRCHRSSVSFRLTVRLTAGREDKEFFNLTQGYLETWWKKTPARQPMKSYCFTSSRWPNIGWRTQTKISIMAYNFGFHYPSTSPELSNALQGKVYPNSETRCTTTTCWTDIQYYGPHKIVRRLFQPPTDILWDVKKNLVRSLYKT